MSPNRTEKISAAAQELGRLPDEVDDAVADARIYLIDMCSMEIIDLISAELPEIAESRVGRLRPYVSEILQELLFSTVSAERSSKNVKKQLARSRGRRGGRVRSNQSRKKQVLDFAEVMIAESPGLSLNEVARRIRDILPGVELSTIRRYLSGFHQNHK